MRVLTVRPGPNFSVADVHRGWVKGLRANGAQVVDLNLDDRLTFYESAEINGTKAVTSEQAVQMAAKGIEVACYEWWPDVVLVTSAFYTPDDLLELLRARGHTVVLLATEEPYELDRTLQRAAHADLVLLNDPTNIDQVRQICPDTFYQPHCYDPDVHRPDGPRVNSEFAFVGTGYPSRIDFFEQVNWDGIEPVLAGNWKGTADGPLERFVSHDLDECFDNTDAAALYRGASMSANLYRKETSDGGHADGWAIGPREVELAACGTFFLREPRGEGDELFADLPTFTGPDEFSQLLTFYRQRPDLRSKAARKAFESIADRTFIAQAAVLMQRLEQTRKGIPHGTVARP